MKIRLKDIIDLDYFISLDEARDSRDDIRSRAVRDRWVYRQCEGRAKTDKEILFSWLKFRKEDLSRDTDKNKTGLLPGTIFSSLYTWMIGAAVFSGGISGISLVISFLAYHGNRPINVAVLIILFIVLPMVLVLLTLVLMVLKNSGIKNSIKFSSSIVYTLVATLFFKILPRFLKRVPGDIVQKNFDTLACSLSFIRMKNREYKDLFFWPFFILIAVFGFSFYAGALGGTFFRVIVSDMAFGWQSTLMATSSSVHDLVKFLALPWSWFVPAGTAFPGLEQIEGSRIILKDGLSVLATQNLVSWWPFICFGILFYGVIPRFFLIILGSYSQRRAVKNYNFDRPEFRLLIIRMRSPLMDIEAEKGLADQSFAVQNRDNNSSDVSRPDLFDQRAMVLVPENIYSEKTIQKIIQGIEHHLFFKVRQVAEICFDLDIDRKAITRKGGSNLELVILVHEVWQPPIRGILYYIKQIRTAMPESWPLYILLTREAGLNDLGVDRNDIDLDVWKKAVLKLETPGILVQRFISS